MGPTDICKHLFYLDEYEVSYAKLDHRKMELFRPECWFLSLYSKVHSFC